MADGRTDWLGLQGRVAVVTGSAGGLGLASAESLARAGAAVALLDLNGDGTAEAASSIKDRGGNAIGIRCDTTDPDSIASAEARIARELGPADILVNNAGILRPGGLDTLSLEDWNKLLGVNLTGYLLCAQTFGAGMRTRKRGAIVHIASIAGSHPQPFSGAYSVTKAGVRMLSRQIAYEWGPSGLRSNCVSPGLVRTPLSEAFYQVPGIAEKRAAILPAGRVGKPADIADAVTFLSSDRASHINGEEIIVDGGLGQILMGQVPRPGFERPQ